MLGIWLFVGTFVVGLGIVLAGRAFARGAAAFDAQDQERKLTWE